MESLTLSNGLVIQANEIIKIEFDGEYRIIYLKYARIIERIKDENTKN